MSKLIRLIEALDNLGFEVFCDYRINEEHPDYDENLNYGTRVASMADAVKEGYHALGGYEVSDEDAAQLAMLTDGGVDGTNGGSSDGSIMVERKGDEWHFYTDGEGEQGGVWLTITPL